MKLCKLSLPKCQNCVGYFPRSPDVKNARVGRISRARHQNKTCPHTRVRRIGRIDKSSCCRATAPPLVDCHIDRSALSLQLWAKAPNDMSVPTNEDGMTPNQRTLTCPNTHGTGANSQNNNSIAPNDRVAILPVSENRRRCQTICMSISTKIHGIRPNQRAVTCPNAHRTGSHSQNNKSIALNGCVAILPASEN